MLDTLEETLQAYLEHKRLRFEGDTGVKNLNELAKVLGYKESGFLYGSPLEQLISDCPGLQEWIVQWVGEQNQLKEWKENLDSELPEDEDEDEDEETDED